MASLLKQYLRMEKKWASWFVAIARSEPEIGFGVPKQVHTALQMCDLHD